MTDDADGVVARITMATLDFAAPQGTVRLTLVLSSPGGDAWEATVTYTDGGAGLTAGQDFGPASGDPDVPVPGMRAEVDAEANAIYMFFDNDATGAEIGDALELTNVNTGRGASIFAFNGQDSLALGASYTLSGAATAGPAGGSGAPLRVFRQAQGHALNESFASPTNATVQYNMTYAGSAGSVDVNVTAAAGSVAVLVLDAANATVAEASFTATGNGSMPFTGAAGGNWTVRLNFTGFNGTLALSLRMPPPVAGNATTTTASSSTTTDDDGRSGTFPLRTTDKGTPGVGLPGLAPALLLAAGVAALAMRRRLD
jgi:hypothetical protein